MLPSFSKSGCLASVSLALLAGTLAYALPPATIIVQMSNGYVQLTVKGGAGSGCTIQSVTNLSRNWQFVTNFTLSSNESVILDGAAPIAAQRFYRAYSQQVPTNVVMTNMLWISPGTFTMGSRMSELGRDPDEAQHEVTITRGFYVGKYEVTQGEYHEVMGIDPSYFSGDLTRPVEQVSWNDAVAYCAALTTREGEAGRLPAGFVYRLPTEAEWEYACRAGTATPFYQGDEFRSGMADFYANYEYLAGEPYHRNPGGIYLSRTTGIGSYAPNPWGLCDMEGNVREWCLDWYAAYPGGNVSDPQGPPAGSYRLIRGGSWTSPAVGCRSADRDYDFPAFKNDSIGFRVVLAPSQP